MYLIKEFSIDELVYDNFIDKKNYQLVEINNDIVEINYNDIIETQFTGENIGQKFEELKNYLNIGIYSKAPCGGFVNFFNIKSKQNIDYIIYSGVNEVSNSHYVVIIHKILWQLPKEK